MVFWYTSPSLQRENIVLFSFHQLIWCVVRNTDSSAFSSSSSFHISRNIYQYILYISKHLQIKTKRLPYLKGKPLFCMFHQLISCEYWFFFSLKSLSPITNSSCTGASTLPPTLGSNTTTTNISKRTVNSLLWRLPKHTDEKHPSPLSSQHRSSVNHEIKE